MHLNAVAYYSIAHMVGFMVLGVLITWLAHEAELHSRHPAAVLLVLFAILEAGFLVVASLVLPGVITSVGIVPIGIANLLAAGAIGLFFVWSPILHKSASKSDTKSDNGDFGLSLCHSS